LNEPVAGQRPPRLAMAIGSIAAGLFGVAIGGALAVMLLDPRQPSISSNAHSDISEWLTEAGSVMASGQDGRSRECTWSESALLHEAKSARPMGPASHFHCKRTYGPELNMPPRPKIRDEVFRKFTEDFDDLFDKAAKLPQSGNRQFPCFGDCSRGNATEHWGASFVTVDGQKHSRGYSGYFSLMSQSKVIAYALAIKLLGINTVRRFVSSEPSGRAFGDLQNMPDSRAFNPYVSTGAEMIWALLDGATPLGYKNSVDANRDIWERMSRQKMDGPEGMRLFGDTISTPAKQGIASLPEDPDPLIEDENPGINLAVIYVMAARLTRIGGVTFPKGWTVKGTYQGFVEVNNLQLTPEMMATVAATLANGGKNPFTGEQILAAREVRYVLSTMVMAGMYDESGRWFFEVGMPAKSGVAGGIMVVAPGVGGFATISEPLNLQGNSARSVAFFAGLVHRFPFMHRQTPGSGLDPNVALEADDQCDLVPTTVQLKKHRYTPL